MPYQNYRNRKFPAKTETTIISSPDTTIMVVVAFLVVLGLMAVFSAGAPKCIQWGQNPASLLFKQLLGLVIGTFGLVYFSKYDYKRLSTWAVPFSWAVVFMLFLVDFTPLGQTTNGATRWINLGFMQFQPSEMAKPAVIMLLANAFYHDSKLFDEVKIKKYFLPIVVIVGLVLKQPNLSMVILLGLVSITMYWIAGGKIKRLILGGIAAVAAMVPFLHAYQLSRLTIWLKPESDPLGAGYNIIQSLIAFAAGGLWGVGFGNSKQKLFWLPEGHTDFILAVIAEEFGFLGCVFIIALFLTFLQRGLVIASRCNNMFGKLLAAGITFSIFIQAFINMAVASSFMPATGVPLPFISYGVTSLVVSLCMVGVLLNISKKRIRRIKNDVVQRRR